MRRTARTRRPLRRTRASSRLPAPPARARWTEELTQMYEVLTVPGIWTLRSRIILNVSKNYSFTILFYDYFNSFLHHYAEKIWDVWKYTKNSNFKTNRELGLLYIIGRGKISTITFISYTFNFLLIRNKSEFISC